MLLGSNLDYPTFYNICVSIVKISFLSSYFLGMGHYRFLHQDEGLCVGLIQEKFIPYVLEHLLDTDF